jgi:ABC-2 type transport system permease protein
LREEVDAVITVPPDPSETVARGEQADLGVLYETSNPVFGLAVPDRSYALVQDLNQSIAQDVATRNIGDVRVLQEQADELNSQLEQVNLAANSLASEEARSTTADLDESLADLEETLETLQESPGETGEEASTTLEQVRETREQLEEVREAQEEGAEEIKRQTGVSELEQTVGDLQNTLEEALTDVPPSVLVTPFRLELENLASPPSLAGFYAPGLLALLIQHMAVSLAALSLIRERLSGAYEFFEVSPLGPGELLAGKFLTYFGLVLGANLTVAAALVYLLGIPLEGGALMPRGLQEFLLMFLAGGTQDAGWHRLPSPGERVRGASTGRAEPEAPYESGGLQLFVYEVG